MRTITCAECGRRFESPANARKFCPECSVKRKAAKDLEYMEHRKKAREEIRANGFAVMICKKCGCEFKSESERRTICDECRRENELRQNRERDKYGLKSFRPERKYCIVCGKEFKPTRREQATCSLSCRNKLADYGWLTDGSTKNKNLTKAAVEAKKAGESYGQYKARLWLEKQKEGKD